MRLALLEPPDWTFEAFVDELQQPGGAWKFMLDLDKKLDLMLQRMGPVEHFIQTQGAFCQIEVQRSREVDKKIENLAARTESLEKAVNSLEKAVQKLVESKTITVVKMTAVVGLFSTLSVLVAKWWNAIIYFFQNIGRPHGNG